MIAWLMLAVLWLWSAGLVAAWAVSALWDLIEYPETPRHRWWPAQMAIAVIAAPLVVLWIGSATIIDEWRHG